MQLFNDQLFAHVAYSLEKKSFAQTNESAVLWKYMFMFWLHLYALTCGMCRWSRVSLFSLQIKSTLSWKERRRSRKEFEKCIFFHYFFWSGLARVMRKVAVGIFFSFFVFITKVVVTALVQQLSVAFSGSSRTVAFFLCDFQAVLNT